MLHKRCDMTQYKAYKIRIYPHKRQKKQIAKTIGCCRFIFNYCLALWQEAYARTGKGLSYGTCSALLPQLKRTEETCWLGEVDSIALQSSVKQLADAYARVQE